MKCSGVSYGEVLGDKSAMYISVGVLVICVLVFNLFCIVCTVFLFLSFRLSIFILICFVCASVTTTATE
jgi:hypothetical protein